MGIAGAVAALLQIAATLLSYYLNPRERERSIAKEIYRIEQKLAEHMAKNDSNGSAIDIKYLDWLRSKKRIS